MRDDIWQVLDDEGYVKEVLDGFPDAFEDMQKKYRYLHKRFPAQAHAQKKEERKEIPPDQRLGALAQILAIEASRLPEVIAFREEVLQGRLLKVEEVSGWIRREAEKQGAGSLWVRLPLPDGCRPSSSRGLRWLSCLADLPDDAKSTWPVQWDAETLAYPGPEDKWVERVAVARDGPLGQLKRVADALLRRFPLWQEAQAVAFVLCDAIPMLPKARGTLRVSSVAPSRITLELDPRLSAREAAGFYAQLRKEALKGPDRPMTEKHLRLAVFLAEHPDMAWEALKGQWNRAYPAWAYSDRRYFARDAKAAWERVTGRGWTARPPGIRRHRPQAREGAGARGE
ncbi:MAG: hypothetical protein QME92_00080 [Bacillota bacterium]|nr:hypothetical protein [Bacillota bacterium]